MMSDIKPIALNNIQLAVEKGPAALISLAYKHCTEEHVIATSILNIILQYSVVTIVVTVVVVVVIPRYPAFLFSTRSSSLSPF